ncbi:hypothetical protein [Halopelagius inordinatus]|nr:hypothetical protein [Halopelagius inordinatus]
MAESHEALSAHSAVSFRAIVGTVVVGSAVSALTLVLLELFGVTWASVGPFTFQPLPGLVAAGAVVAGPAAVVGTIVGYLCYQFVYGVFALWETAGYLLLGALVVVFWHGARSAYSGDTAAGRYLHFAIVAATASLWAATLTTWGLELAGRGRFFPAFAFFTVDALFSTLTLGGAVYVAFERLSGTDGLLASLRRVQPLIELTERPTRAFRFEILAVPFAWFLVGSTVSIGFQTVELVPRFHFRLRGLGALTVFKETWLFGRGGTTVLAAGGAACLVLLVAMLYRWNAVRPQ